MRQQHRREFRTGSVGRVLARLLVVRVLLGAAPAAGEAGAEPAAALPLALDFDGLFRLTPPALIAERPAPAPNLVDEIRIGPARHPALLTLDLSVHYLRLAVHGDRRPGLTPFLGTSTAAFAGLRLRF